MKMKYKPAKYLIVSRTSPPRIGDEEDCKKNEFDMSFKIQELIKQLP